MSNTVPFPTVTKADLAKLVAPFQRWLDGLSAACAKLAEAFRAVNEKLLCAFPSDPAAMARLRRSLWTGLARRHAERPPLRGFWAHRCHCPPCRERKGLA